MSIFEIELFFVVGLLTLIIGKIIKKKWVVMIAIVPLAISIFQVLILLISFI